MNFLECPGFDWQDKICAANDGEFWNPDDWIIFGGFADSEDKVACKENDQCYDGIINQFLQNMDIDKGILNFSLIKNLSINKICIILILSQTCLIRKKYWSW